MKVVFAQGCELDIIYFALIGRKAAQQVLAFFGSDERNPPSITARLRLFHQTETLQLTGDGGDKCAAHMQMISYGLDVYVAVKSEMADEDQNGVSDPRQSDLPGVAVANGFV